jgi:Tfp pilus assembly protein PilF
LYEGQGEKELAAKEFQEALQLDPKDKTARESLKRLGRD